MRRRVEPRPVARRAEDRCGHRRGRSLALAARDVEASELFVRRTERTEDVVQPGDVVQVKLLAVDERGRLKLSRRAAMNGN